MINNQNVEVNLNNCINSILRARDINGNIQKITILQKAGPLIYLTDEKGAKYKFPPEVTVNLLPKFKDDFDEEAKVYDKIVSLQFCYEEFGAESFIIENYLGNPLQVTIEKIVKEEKYGWPIESFVGQEQNLIINYNV